MMNKTVGVCGFASTGSSAFADLLHEFDETQVLNTEFRLTHLPDGLEDLEYHLKNYRGVYDIILSIARFRKFVNAFSFYPVTRKEANKLVDEFFNKIIQLSWSGESNFLNLYLRSSMVKFIRRVIYNRFFRFYNLFKNMYKFFAHKMELCNFPEVFDEASMDFVSDMLYAMGIDYNHKEKKTIVINQPFAPCNPVKSFKFFRNPSAIISDRDPRDLYLFVKKFLRSKGINLIPCDNVDDFIKYFRIVRQSPSDLRGRSDVLFLNFEELVYDYENTVKKVANFVGVTQHIHKGKYFKPTHSRSNTQLFKKYTGFESDIKKIEKELPEYIFPFENYPDIEQEGGMFWGSQINKGR